MFQTNLNTLGYDLYEVSSDRWVLDFKNGNVYYGTFKDIVFYMVNKLEFNLSEIDSSIKTAIFKDHNAIHFGIFKSMIFTFAKETNYEEKAS